jgi:hypothetical protein
MLNLQNQIASFKLVLALAATAFFSNAHALQAFQGKVTTLEPTYLPGMVAFAMDVGNPSCPAGTWLFWINADSSNNKAVYATLLTALSTGKKITFHMNDGDTSCTGKYLHLIAD